MEVGIFLAITFLADFEEIEHLSDLPLYTFYGCTIVVGVLLGVFTAYSLESAMFLQGISVSIMFTYSVAMLTTLIFETGMSRTIFWILCILLSLVVVGISSSPKFVYNYAYRVFVNVNQPFYFMFCLALYLEIYPEFMTINIALNYGIQFRVDKWNWLIFLAQIFFSVVLVAEAFGLIKWR